MHLDNSSNLKKVSKIEDYTSLPPKLDKKETAELNESMGKLFDSFKEIEVKKAEKIVNATVLDATDEEELETISNIGQANIGKEKSNRPKQEVFLEEFEKKLRAIRSKIIAHHLKAKAGIGSLQGVIMIGKVIIGPPVFFLKHSMPFFEILSHVTKPLSLVGAVLSLVSSSLNLGVKILEQHKHSQWGKLLKKIQREDEITVKKGGDLVVENKEETIKKRAEFEKLWKEYDNIKPLPNPDDTKRIFGLRGVFKSDQKEQVFKQWIVLSPFDTHLAKMEVAESKRLHKTEAEFDAKWSAFTNNIKQNPEMTLKEIQAMSKEYFNDIAFDESDMKQLLISLKKGEKNVELKGKLHRRFANKAEVMDKMSKKALKSLSTHKFKRSNRIFKIRTLLAVGGVLLAIASVAVAIVAICGCPPAAAIVLGVGIGALAFTLLVVGLAVEIHAHPHYFKAIVRPSFAKLKVLDTKRKFKKWKLGRKANKYQKKDEEFQYINRNFNKLIDDVKNIDQKDWDAKLKEMEAILEETDLAKIREAKDERKMAISLLEARRDKLNTFHQKYFSDKLDKQFSREKELEKLTTKVKKIKAPFVKAGMKDFKTPWKMDDQTNLLDEFPGSLASLAKSGDLSEETLTLMEKIYQVDRDELIVAKSEDKLHTFMQDELESFFAETESEVLDAFSKRKARAKRIAKKRKAA